MVWFPGFTTHTIPTGDVEIHAVVGGSGPPLLLLHGHPETHVAWWKVAPRLAQRYTVVATDMRGYGASAKPRGSADHATYSKRVMGADQVGVMDQLGFSRFQAVGHDRGGRVLHRMMLDHPETITRGVVLDIAPTDMMYDQTDEAFATAYFWWFFHIQDQPLPEEMIGSNVELYLRSHLDQQSKTAGAVTDDAFAEYLRHYRDPAGIHAVCEDYRASVGIDRDHTRADRAAGRKVEPPLLAIWGAKGTVGELFDVPGMWRMEADQLTAFPLDCGHLIPEEAPEALLDALEHYLDR